MKGKMGKKITTLSVVIFWLFLWQLAAVFLDNSILLAGPADVFLDLKENAATASFWKTAGNSFFHILEGFLLGFLAAFLLGTAAAKLPLLEELLSPFMQLVKAVPVASFVVLLLIWFGSARLSVAVTFLMVLPVIYLNVLSGIRHVDKELLEMAKVFEMPAWNRVLFLYRPALMPFLVSGCRAALGMSWKAGVAAEVIGTPDFSIGERIYMSKIYLDTAGVFSWTMVVILLSFLFEKAFLKLLSLLEQAHLEPVLSGAGKEEQGEAVMIEGLRKSYGGKEVIKNFTARFEPGAVYCIMGESGCGKTTLFRVLSGLISGNGGNIRKPHKKCSVVFQENRLCPAQTPLDNVRMTAGKGLTIKETEEILLEILPQECLYRETCQLSGGMQRRTAIARAVLSSSGWMILDEPFTGLDEETKKRTMAFILKYQAGRTILIATHQKEDAHMLGAEIVLLDKEKGV